jgi:hypothetical protein
MSGADLTPMEKFVLRHTVDDCAVLSVRIPPCLRAMNGRTQTCPMMLAPR